MNNQTVFIFSIRVESVCFRNYNINLSFCFALIYPNNSSYLKKNI